MDRPLPTPFTPPQTLTLLRRLLLLPLLAPLLAVLLLAVFNPRPAISLRLLTSRSPALPLGLWLAVGGASGALLSALATTLALREGSRRWTGGRNPAREPWFQPPAGAAQDQGDPDSQRFRWRPEATPQDLESQGAPERAPGEPPPTVSVPFRVIRRPPRSARSAASQPPTTPVPTTSSGQAAAEPDDWNTAVQEEDW